MKNYTIDLEQIINRHSNSFGKLPSVIKKLIVKLLRGLMSVEKLEQFLNNHRSVRGINLIDDFFDMLEVSFLISPREIERIPVVGKVICVSNHPLGGLDGLMILKAISEVRADVRIVVNDVLLVFDNLSDMFLPVDIFSGNDARESVVKINEAIKNEEAIIFFPAAEVSRMSLRGIKDIYWKTGAMRFAQSNNVPVLPIFVESRNSIMFYIISFIWKKLSTIMLARELLKKRKKAVRIYIGELIQPAAFTHLNTKIATKLMRKQVESLPVHRKGPFKTERGIAKATERRTLRRELYSTMYLGSPALQKHLFIANTKDSPSVVREIARLREITFRQVGEGTGNRLDIDKYDHHYRHLLLWDDERLEIVGAYRLGFCDEIMPNHGVDGLYTSTLFSYSDEFKATLSQSVEMGRSFIQRPYWNSYALEYLWAGIGAVIANEPFVKYLYGPVTISNNYSDEAKQAMIFVYKKWYSAPKNYVKSKYSYEISEEQINALSEYFCGKSYKEDLNKLKLRLRALGVSVPTLLRQYAELCSSEGIKFCDFGVDNSFGHCIDGFFQLDVTYLTEEKYERYIGQYSSVLKYPGRGIVVKQELQLS